jgi:hypothetical protein
MQRMEAQGGGCRVPPHTPCQEARTGECVWERRTEVRVRRRAGRPCEKEGGLRERTPAHARGSHPPSPPPGMLAAMAPAPARSAADRRPKRKSMSSCGRLRVTARARVRGCARARRRAANDSDPATPILAGPSEGYPQAYFVGKLQRGGPPPPLRPDCANTARRRVCVVCVRARVCVRACVCVRVRTLALPPPARRGQRGAQAHPQAGEVLPHAAQARLRRRHAPVQRGDRAVAAVRQRGCRRLPPRRRPTLILCVRPHPSL